ncbi:MAG TPA: NADP-dependent oxidoreductase, partial [Stenomitos sp.]
AFAEYACVDASLAAKVPDSVDLTMAAGVPLAGLTALQCLRDELQVQPGQRLFISGGAGGVGTFALQLAKRFGADVTTTASARGEALVRRLGADRVIDYIHERFWEGLKDMDGALDLVGGDTLDHCFEIVKRGGRVVSIAGLPEPATARRDLDAGPGLAALFWLISMKWRRLARRHGVTYRYKFMHPSGAELAELAGMLAKNELQIVVDRVFPFEAIGDAFAYLEKGRAKGKVIVTMEG